LGARAARARRLSAALAVRSLVSEPRPHPGVRGPHARGGRGCVRRGRERMNPAELMRDAPPVAAVREGYELHYGRPEVVQTDDPDLALLAGDRLYALGLEKLAAGGDLEAIGVLCATIATCARGHAEHAPEQAQHARHDATHPLAR